MTVFDSIAETTALDRPAAAARAVVGRVLTNRRVEDALHGVWLGHPLHPALAQLTLGAFTSAAALDASGVEPRASSLPITAGAVAAVQAEVRARRAARPRGAARRLDVAHDAGPHDDMTPNAAPQSARPEGCR